MSRDILTNNRKQLTIFENNVVIDKNLPKWRRAENGLEKTKVNNTESNTINTNTSVLSDFLIINSDEGLNPTPIFEGTVRDVDSDVSSSLKWLPLYEIADGVSFDQLATAGIKDLTRLIAEKKLKFVIGGYGSLGNTQSSGNIILTNNNMDAVVSSYNTQIQKAMEDSMKKNFFYKIKTLFKKKENEQNVEEKYIDALQFFSMVKASSKESVSTYRDRISGYLKSIHNAVSVGQTALVEDLLRGLVTNKYESVLYAEGLYYVVNEDQMVSFVNQCEKGIKLDYIKNFTRPLPQEVVDKVNKINQLEVFDNYVVLYYDPDGKIYKETAKEEAKRKDPIIFGLIAGSKKLYYVTDWVDEYCDLTLEKFIDAIGVKQEELHMDFPNIDKETESIEVNDTEKKKRKKRNYKKKSNKTFKK